MASSSGVDVLVSGPSGWGYGYPNVWKSADTLARYVATSDDYALRAGLREARWRTTLVERLRGERRGHGRALRSRRNAGAPRRAVIAPTEISAGEKSDRAAMNKRVFAALKPGGGYGVVDHAAAQGAGDSAAKTLHRIEKSLVVNEATAAGFKLAKESDLLKMADDPHSTNAIKEQRGKSDRFVLKFEKPK